jgi:hypothetical protein
MGDFDGNVLYIQLVDAVGFLNKLFIVMSDFFPELVCYFISVMLCIAADFHICSRQQKKFLRSKRGTRLLCILQLISVGELTSSYLGSYWSS